MDFKNKQDEDSWRELQKMTKELRAGENLSENYTWITKAAVDVEGQMDLAEKVDDTARLLNGYPLLVRLQNLRIEILKQQLAASKQQP